MAKTPAELKMSHIRELFTLERENIDLKRELLEKERKILELTQELLLLKNQESSPNPFPSEETVAPEPLSHATNGIFSLLIKGEIPQSQDFNDRAFYESLDYSDSEELVTPETASKLFNLPARIFRAWSYNNTLIAEYDTSGEVMFIHAGQAYNLSHNVDPIRYCPASEIVKEKQIPSSTLNAWLRKGSVRGKLVGGIWFVEIGQL